MEGLFWTHSTVNLKLKFESRHNFTIVKQFIILFYVFGVFSTIQTSLV